MIRSSALPSAPPVHPDKTLKVTVTYLNLSRLTESAPAILSQISSLTLPRTKEPTVSLFLISPLAEENSRNPFTESREVMRQLFFSFQMQSMGTMTWKKFPC
jgi:hypothetical protein